MKIKIENYSTGSVLFEYEKKNNTLKDTLIEAVKCGVDLRGADLRGTDLSCADLRGANLIEVNLNCASLRGANLIGINLNGAYLRSADLRGTNLMGASLSGADLMGANLRCANLRDADLRGASLIEAGLYATDLRNADLYGVNLRDANLCKADLIGAKNIPFIPFACPSDGSFVGWKKISYYSENYSGVYLVKLGIPADARRCSATTGKCRCDKAEVLEITNIKTNEKVDVITNMIRSKCVYRVGEMVYPDDFDEDRWNECSHGIHFFINKQEAIDY
jgi:hypothetical protein